MIYSVIGRDDLQLVNTISSRMKRIQNPLYNTNLHCAAYAKSWVN